MQRSEVELGAVGRSSCEGHAVLLAAAGGRLWGPHHKRLGRNEWHAGNAGYRLSSRRSDELQICPCERAVVGLARYLNGSTEAA